MSEPRCRRCGYRTHLAGLMLLHQVSEHPSLRQRFRRWRQASVSGSTEGASDG